jgi:predicted ATP-dependent protease
MGRPCSSGRLFVFSGEAAMTIQIGPGKIIQQPGRAENELPAEALARLCDPAGLSFATTRELPRLQDVIGQPRAFKALELGSEVGGFGYNIFVLGIPDSGRTTLTRAYLLRKAAQAALPQDWCYVNNFDNPHKPVALALPGGLANDFRKEMRLLVAECTLNIPQAFSSEEYIHEHDRLVNAMKDRLGRELSQLEEYAGQHNFVIMKTPYGLFLGPAVAGKPLTNDEVEKLAPEQKEKLHQLQEKLSESLQMTLARMREIERSIQEEMKDLDLRTALYIVRPLIDELKEKYAGVTHVLAYLEQTQKDILHNLARFRSDTKAETNPIDEKAWAVRYEVNVLVDQTGCSGAPVIVENQPTYHNLLGSIEHDIILGASYTDFSKIRPGALHRANGGYLILPARDVLINPSAWEGLKRVLRDGQIRMIELGSQMGLASAATLEPEPVPLNVKVILVGTPILYYLLRAYDEDFAKLFKVRAEFATEIERSPQSEGEYALFVKSVVDDNGLIPFDRTAVARIIEQGSRMVEHQEKLSAQFGVITDLICESAYWARKNALDCVDGAAVQKALDERTYRSSLVEERIQELIEQDILIVSVDEAAVGQINALSVSSLGGYAFGRPCRVTASVWAGQAGVVDIERQARLGGPVHTKGVLIIGGYIGGRFGQNRPLNLSASLTFEQSYDEIEGDSASAAELIALLSALSGTPIEQGRAITGSVNQYGQIQAIGGVNEKIEGFFETCRRKGLTGRQGVIIPRANRSSLMLRRDVREAAALGTFHIWTVETIDEAVCLLTRREPGEKKKDGSYPDGTLYYAVAERLEAFARLGERKKKAKTEKQASE